MKKKTLIVIIGGLLFLLALFVLTIGAFDQVKPDYLNNSDIGWTLAFIEDLFKNGGSFTDWHLSHHSDLFPDKILSFISWSIAPTKEWFYVIFSYFNWVLWSLTTYLISKRFSASILASFIPLFFINFNIGLPALVYPFWPTFHFSTLMLLYISFYFFRRSDSVWISFLCGVSLFLCFVSDKLIVLYFLIFFIAEYFLNYIKTGNLKFKISKFWWQSFGIITAAWFFQNKIFKIFASYAGVYQISFKDYFFYNIKMPHVIVAFVLFSSLLLFRKKVKSFYLKISEKDREVFLWFCVAVLIPLALFLKFYVYIRYVSPSYYIFIFCFSYFISRKVSKKSLTVFLTSLIFVVLLWGTIYTKVKPSSIGIHPLAKCLNETSKEINLKSGIGDYWNTHAVNLNGNELHPIRAVFKNMTAYHWVNSKAWYKEDFNFIVTRNNDLDISLLDKIVTGKVFVKSCSDGYKIHVLNKVQELEFKKSFNSL